MNKSLLFGFVGVNVVFLIATVMSLGNPMAVLDTHAILMVVGGSVMVAIFSNSITDVKQIFFDAKDMFLDKFKETRSLIIDDIANLAKAKRRSEKEFVAASQLVSDPFLREASRLLFWAETEASAEDFKNLLEIKAETYLDQYMKSPTLLKGLAKYPPAFGLMGTVLGMVSMMSKLSDPSAKGQIGPSMAIALMATLYGIALNNLFIIPLAEQMTHVTKLRGKTYELVIEGVMMIHGKKPVNYIKEKLLGYIGDSQKQTET